MVRLCLVLGAFLLLLSSGGPRPYEIDTLTRAAYAKACNHYVNRARFMERGTRAEFVVVLADSCAQAIGLLDAPTTGERRAAANFLAQLQSFRDTIIDMNMERVFGKSYTPFTRIQTAQAAQTEPVGKVSAAGEYLIAHRMGLLDAYKAWLDTGPVMAAAQRSKG